MNRSILTTLLLVLGVLLSASPALAGPARPDPRQMSGIPRPDPQIPAGEVTVRVLRGSFDAPVLDAVVELELRSADGRIAELRSAEAGNQGRAHFRDLGPFLGGQAVARVVVDGETIRSRQIDVRKDAGTAVMLVKGAPKAGAGQEVSLPGIVFDFPKSPAGSLMVGVFDLGTRKGLDDTEVQLVVTTPDGQTSTRSQKTTATGQTSFEGMTDLPPGAVVQVKAQLDEEGEPYRSQTFTPDPSRGQAVVLARGRMGSAGSNPHQGGQGGQGGAARAPTKLPGPRIARELANGTLQIMVVDSNDQPVPDQEVTIVKKDFSGTEKRFTETTDAEGMVTRANLPLAINDGLYYVGVPYDGAPYTSPFFGMDKRGGVRVAVRVYPVTKDPAVARSFVQWEVIEGENDHASVVQLYQVAVRGDKAFWPGEEGLQIVGLPGAKSMVVMRGSEDWLDHEEKAPFATLSRPLVPGEAAQLSVGYVIEHDGAIEFDWKPPFEVVESVAVVSDAHVLDAPGATRSEEEIPDQAGLDYVRVPWTLGQKGNGALRFSVSGLRRTDQRFTQIGLWGGATLGLVLLLGIALRPQGDTRSRLLRRREELLAALEIRRTQSQRERVIAALDRVYRQLDALDEVAGSKRSPKGPDKGQPKSAGKSKSA
ncbi:MAG: Ig-like domain-containing protein [Myxococcota bacterium]